MLLLAFPAASHAAFPGQNGKLAFYNGASSTPGVWTMNPDGTGQAFLRAGSAPAWSPGGTELLFVREQDVRRMPASGSSETELLSAHYQPFWGTFWFDPTWSPDGTHIAATFEEIIETDNPSYSVYAARADGTGRVDVAPAGASPAWRPDGEEIAYAHLYTFGGGIRAVRPDGTGRRTIVADEDENGDPVYADHPDFSPDGSKLAFERDGAIYVVPTAGGTPALLTDDGFSPAWSPDGTKIAFASLRDGNSEIYTMNADGSSQTRITNDPGAQWDPSWQPVVPGYVRPQTASPVRVSLVPAYAPCTAPNRQHGPPLAFGSCNPPDEESPELTVGSGMTGLVRLASLQGDPSAPGDQADIGMRVQVSDVRVQGTLGDYAGEVEARATARLTDRGSGGPATAGDVFFPLHTQCTATAAADVGSTCSLNTTLDALIPDAISEGQRTVLGLTQIQVYDGGADGDTATQPNSVFLRQGVFVP